jgi:hypothetical protein
MTHAGTVPHNKTLTEKVTASTLSQFAQYFAEFWIFCTTACLMLCFAAFRNEER